jgi:hypothetical protein
MFEQNGKRRTKAATDDTGRMLPKPPGGVFYIRWNEGSRQRWKQVGDIAWDALQARGLQEDVLAGKRDALEERSEPRSVTLAEAIEAFLAERSAQTGELSFTGSCADCRQETSSTWITRMSLRPATRRAKARGYLRSGRRTTQARR